jgi:hypothetical protein
LNCRAPTGGAYIEGTWGERLARLVPAVAIAARLDAHPDEAAEPAAEGITPGSARPIIPADSAKLG